MIKSKYRIWIQCLFFALTNGYVKGFVEGKIFTGNTKYICSPGLNCYSCPGAFFACPIGSLQKITSKNIFKISLYVVGWISLIGILCGRFVCGFLCPFGLVQDLLFKLPILKNKKEKSFNHHNKLKYIKYIVLVLLVILLTRLITAQYNTIIPWFCKLICPSGTLFGAIPLVLKNESLKAIIGLQFVLKLGILFLILLASIVRFRPFCKYLCPLGIMYGLFNKLSLYQFSIDLSKCTNCGACEKVCKMSINPKDNPNSVECIRCNECIDACSEKAITVGNKKAILNNKMQVGRENV